MSARLVGEMIRVALSAIWTNKLRSFLTILGNVVAVASIVTLVSLIEGINDQVTSVIVTEVGADSFMVDRIGLVTSQDDMEAAENNPLITLDDQTAVRRFGSNFAAVIAQGDNEARFAIVTKCWSRPRFRVSPASSIVSPRSTPSGDV